MMPQFVREADLRAVEARLANEPESAALHFERAHLLDALGRTSEARDAYIEVLKREPTHFDALNNCGTMLFNAGFRSAARLLYAEAVKWHPQNPMPYVNLGNTLFELGDLRGAREQYEAALRLDASYAAAHQGLSYIFTRDGDLEAAARHRALGFASAPIAIVQYRGDAAPISVLVLLSAIGGNVATDLFLDDRTFLTVKLFTEYYDPELPLPPHDVVLNAIGDVELCADALTAAERLVTATDRAVINAPVAIRATSRSAIAQLLAGIQGLVTPKTVAFPRARLASDDEVAVLADAGFTFPFLVRSPGFHTGEHFVKVDRAEDLRGAIEQLPGETLLAIEYLNARDDAGNARKYRVMMIGGKLYPLHLAISSQWKVHYFTADLHDGVHREAEAVFLNDMHAALGPHAIHVLEQICDALALDYAGVDFGIDRNGKVLLFEANATMKIVPPPAGAEFDYRRGAAQRALAAARERVLAAN